MGIIIRTRTGLKKRKGVFKRKKVSKIITITKSKSVPSKKNSWGPSSPFPLVMFKRLTYTTELTMTQATGGIPIYHLFRANSLYDPDQTGSGSQPRYFDQLCGNNSTGAIYNQYRVLGCKITAKVFPTSSTALDQNCVFAITPLNATSGVPNSLHEMKERPQSRYTYITTIGSAKPYSVNNAIGLAKFLGNKDIMDNPDSSATYANNPVDSVSWALTCCAVNPIGLASVSVVVTMSFACQFFNCLF